MVGGVFGGLGGLQTNYIVTTTYWSWVVTTNWVFYRIFWPTSESEMKFTPAQNVVKESAGCGSGVEGDTVQEEIDGGQMLSDSDSYCTCVL